NLELVRCERPQGGNVGTNLLIDDGADRAILYDHVEHQRSSPLGPQSVAVAHRETALKSRTGAASLRRPTFRRAAEGLEQPAPRLAQHVGDEILNRARPGERVGD